MLGMSRCCACMREVGSSQGAQPRGSATGYRAGDCRVMLNPSCRRYFSGNLLGLQQAYFTLWAPVIVVEGIVRRALRKAGIQVPTPVAWLATMLIRESPSLMAGAHAKRGALLPGRVG